MRKSGLLPVCLALLALAAAAVPVQAEPLPRVANIYNCDQANHNVLLASGKHVFIDYGWETKNAKQTYSYLASVKTIVKVDGVRIVNADFYWSRPYIDEFGYWSIDWRYPLAKLAVGEAHTVTLQSDFKVRVTDGFAFYGPGKEFHPALSCTIIGS
ncbi:MAG TPA: hypothetical protein VH371_08350 [Candidatus Limnocylindrales bacterium]